MTRNAHDTDKQRDSELLARRGRQVQRGAARAAVLGVNDGLVSTLCLVLAVAGAQADGRAVLLAGFAGLLAGAVSMAAGEWISVTSQVELFRGILADLRQLIRDNRDLLRDQLAERLVRHGTSREAARVVARDLARDDHALRDAYATQVMGVNPHELGSPWTAAVSSFVLFATGSLVPLAPWFFVSGPAAAMLSATLTVVAAALVGGYIGRTSGSGTVRSAVRQALIVVFAAVVTYGAGSLFGAVV